MYGFTSHSKNRCLKQQQNNIAAKYVNIVYIHNKVRYFLRKQKCNVQTGSRITVLMKFLIIYE